MRIKVIKLDPFKRGDTPVFSFIFSSPTVGFSWVGIVADVSLTAVSSPSDNSGAGMVRIGQALTTNTDGSATVSVQLTPIESKALLPKTDYHLELQLRDGSGLNVSTGVTGIVHVEQDYVI